MANQVVQITAGSGTNIQTFENTINSAVVEAQAMSLVDASGLSIGTAASPLQIGLVASSTSIVARGDGFLRITTDPTTMLADTFEAALDTINVWTVGGTVPPAVINGVLTLAPNTTASATAYIASKPTFIQGIAAYLQYVTDIQIEAGVVTGNQRFWGLGVVTTPTTSLPITNGVVFEIDSATGGLFCSVYSNGARTQTTTITRPADGILHRYAIYYKSSRVYYELDNILVATFINPNPAIQAFSLVIGSINGGSTVGSAPVLNETTVGVGDTGRNAVQLSDGRFPWREATVTAPAVAAATTDTALVVAPSPNTVGPVSITDLAASIKTMIGMLEGLPLAIEQSSGRMRVVLDALGGAQTLGTVTTVTTVTNLTRMGTSGTEASAVPSDITMTAWALNCRGRIT
jgi:hypothetical protein